MKKIKFKKGKQYYLPNDDWNIRYIEETLDGYHVFKYVKHEELEEYSTKDGTEVWENKRAYEKYRSQNLSD